MKHRNSHFAVGYWSRLRRGRATPDQADIDPKALKRVLPYIFLIDARPEASLAYRLAGTGLCERFGQELRGRSFLSQWDPESRSALTALLRQSLRTRQPVCLTSIAATDDCRMVELEIVLMPISFGGKEPERFLGVVQFLSDLSAVGGKPFAFQRLVASSLIQEDEAVMNSDVTPPAPPSEPARQPQARASHLRLVVSREGSAPLRRDPAMTMKQLFGWFAPASA